MLLVDEAEKKDENSCRGSYTVKGDEWFLQGHFPGKPTVPGVVLCEMMGQACAVILADKVQGSIPYFTGIKNAKFKHPVLPGDTLEIECAMTKNRAPSILPRARAASTERCASRRSFPLRW